MIGCEEIIFEISLCVHDQRAGTGIASFESIKCYAADFVAPVIGNGTNHIIITTPLLLNGEAPGENVSVATPHHANGEGKVLQLRLCHGRFQNKRITGKNRCPQLSCGAVIDESIGSELIVMLHRRYEQTGALGQIEIREAQVDIRGTGRIDI